MLTWFGSYLFCYAVMILLIGASIWRTRVPTIDAMHAQMLRDVWAEWRVRKARIMVDPAVGIPIQGLTIMQLLRLFDPLVTHYADEHGTIHRKLYDRPSDAQSEIDRINELWSPTTKHVIDEYARGGPFGYRSGRCPS